MLSSLPTWGARFGWLTGLPLLAGPISVFVCLEQGAAFAAHSAGTTLLGMWSSCAFCLAYFAASSRGWPLASLAAIAAFVAGTATLRSTVLPAWVGLAGVFAGAWLCLRVIAPAAPTSPTARPPGWEMPARLLVAAAYVLLQTGIAAWIGPQLSGLITPFPIVVILLTAFAHRGLGRDGATRVLRGFLLGMYAFGSFFLMVAVSLGRLSPSAAYSLALLVCVAIGLCEEGASRKLAP